jgi:4-amino-4-deoxy-L-arabinose transferase-like glycosyltransferase
VGRVLPPVAPLDGWARWTILVILAIGALVRVAWGLFWAEPPGGDLIDPVLYSILADQIAHGHGFTYPGAHPGPTAYYPPGYPLALGAVLFLVGLLPGHLSLFAVAVSFNIVLSVATVWMVFELGRRLVSVPVGLIGAALMALWPNAIVHTGLVMTETLFLFLFVAMLLVALATAAVTRAPGWRRMAATGVLFGLAGMVRPTSFVIAPLFLLLWWPAGAKVALRRTVLVGALVLAMVLPWTIRNAVQIEAPVLVSANLGDNMCIGNNPEATGAYELPDSCFAGLHGGERPKAEVERQSKTFHTAFDYIREHPDEFVGKMPAKLGYTMYRDTDGLWTATSFGAKPFVSAERFQQLKWVSTGYWRVVEVLGLIGAVALWWRRDREQRRAFFLLVAVVQLVPAVITFGDPRFKMPLYPTFALCAGVAVMALLQRRLPATDVEPPADEPDAHVPDAASGTGDESGEKDEGSEPEPQLEPAPSS